MVLAWQRDSWPHPRSVLRVKVASDRFNPRDASSLWDGLIVPLT